MADDEHLALVSTGRFGDTAPPDFEQFWTATVAALAHIPFDIHDTTRPGAIADTTLHDVSLLSWDHRRIQGYALTWDDDRPRPLVVHSHGYRSQVEPQHAWAARAGCHVVGIDVRGFGRSVGALPEPSPWGWLLTGARQPETSVLRGAVCDYVRAAQVATRMLPTPASRIVCHGVSLAGGLATMATAIVPQADLLVVGVPTFGWSEGRRLLVERGSGAEISGFLEGHPQYPEDDLQQVLCYFDSALFAPAIDCPTLVGIGRVDRVVPAPCVAPVAAALHAPHEVMEFPVSHAAGDPMREWDRFDDRWLALARYGVPADFGQQRTPAALDGRRPAPPTISAAPSTPAVSVAPPLAPPRRGSGDADRR